MKKGKIIIISIIGIITILITSFVMVFVLYYTKSNHLNVGTSDGWLGFYGGFIGSIISLPASVGITIWQIKDEKEYQANILREERNFEKLKKLDDDIGIYISELNQAKANFQIYYLAVINKFGRQSKDINKTLEISVDNYNAVCNVLDKFNKEVLSNIILRNMVTNTLSDNKKYEYEFSDVAAAVLDLQSLLITNSTGWKEPAFKVKDDNILTAIVLAQSMEYIYRKLKKFFSDTESALIEQRTDIKSKIDK